MDSVLWTISVLLWTITMILTAFWRIWMLCTVSILLTFSYCCFRKTVSNHYFQKKVLLIAFSSTYHNWLKNLSFTQFLLIKGYRNTAQKMKFSIKDFFIFCAVKVFSMKRVGDFVPFVEWFKTQRGSSSWILLVLFNDRKPWTNCFTKGSSHCSFGRATFST